MTKNQNEIDMIGYQYRKTEENWKCKQTLKS